MKAYEFPSKLNAQGSLEIPEAVLKHLSSDQEIKIIVLVSEPPESSEQSTTDNELGFSATSFQESWKQANNGQTLSLRQLWEGIDVD
ncbi:MAG: hypothetical protein KME11_15715 [Timaviella obliquedivisa GSE-PSE-MK23-08B]|jgi:hypothetical protein|nr:hypothetical protein [Timaviella obliquedivisa GSE-PSE-MK23-08B]